MTVSQLSREMTAAEEAHWIALYQRQPWGERPADARNALIAQLLYNANAPKGKSKKLEDFMLFGEKRRAVGDDPKTIRSNFESFIAAQRKRGIK